MRWHGSLELGTMGIKAAPLCDHGRRSQAVLDQAAAALQQSELSVLAGSGLVELGDRTRQDVVVDVLTEGATELRAGAAVQLLDWGDVVFPEALRGKAAICQVAH